MSEFRLDVVLRTHNRADLVGEAAASLLAADRSGIDLRLFIIDNASTDDTAALLGQLAARHGPIVIPLYEAKPGGQHALNTAIAACTAPVIAFFDDDERVAADWLQVIAREMADEATDFIAGPCRPLWTESSGGKAPDWLPEGFGGVLGIIGSGPVRRQLGPGFGGMLTQGNCAVRRAIFAEAGPYPDALATGEDRWLYEWLIRQGRRGFYCPDLVIHHIMQPDRVSRDYFRRWSEREGRDRARVDAMQGKRLLQMRQPWFWRRTLDDFCKLVLGRGSSRFAAELRLRQALAYARCSFKGA